MNSSTVSNILAIIPARGGSKGVPRKNIRVMAGRPLIEYSIRAARGSRFAPRITVSTEDAEIADVARRLGAEVPFLRPAELAGDNIPTQRVLEHALTLLHEREGYRPDWVLILQPTSPLRTARHIDSAISLLTEQGGDSVVGVCLAEHSPYWMKTIDAQGVARPFLKDAPVIEQRQGLPGVYRINGAIYITRPQTILRTKRILGDKTLAYVMSQEDSVDIDTEIDFWSAEHILLRKEQPACI